MFLNPGDWNAHHSVICLIKVIMKTFHGYLLHTQYIHPLGYVIKVLRVTKSNYLLHHVLVVGPFGFVSIGTRDTTFDDKTQTRLYLLYSEDEKILIITRFLAHTIN